MWTQTTVAVITGLVAGLGSALLTTRLQHHFWKLQREDERRFWELQRSLPTARPHHAASDTAWLPWIDPLTP